MNDERPPQDETPKERADRELIELLNELRVVLPGITVLLGFLLAVPFARGWTRVTEFQRDVFVIAFLATAVSVARLALKVCRESAELRPYGLHPAFRSLRHAS